MVKIKDGKIVVPESTIQIQLSRWFKVQYPNILFTASAGGMRTSIGVAKKMKAMGYSKGTPDIMIFYPTKNYHGCLLELKTESGIASNEQKEWIKTLAQLGYYAKICYGYDDTEKTISEYMGL
mgnify:FL=1